MMSFRRLWRRLWMKFGVGIGKTVYRDDLATLEKAYRVEDPWDMSSPAEQKRFEDINATIVRGLGRPASVLEIGSGEGHHTEKLLALGASVDCVEISAQAVARARKRCPAARIVHGSFPAVKKQLKDRYDLVLASEVLYYMADVEAAVAEMNRLGGHCLVTFYAPETERLSPLFDRIPDVIKSDLSREAPPCLLYFWEPTKRSAV
jgi:SAM-dependent methyltransferase